MFLWLVEIRIIVIRVINIKKVVIIIFCRAYRTPLEGFMVGTDLG